ncbi:MAG: class I SAM-dependent methyltransferase [Treponema sp.]|jgi:SAM-dependent methyltransferase|nr:class I SAM-dependent methyltransferase [Treponema sp.]
MKALKRKILPGGGVQIYFLGIKVLSYTSAPLKELERIERRLGELFPPDNRILIRESRTAHRYLNGLRGIEIGGGAHSPFGLNTLNVDYTDESTVFTKACVDEFHCEPLKVDIVAPGDDLPFKDNTWDFVVNAHVLEHFFDPIKAITEWIRVIRPGGILFMIVPHKDRIFDYDKPRTTLGELIDRHEGNVHRGEESFHNGHHSFWFPEDVVELCTYLGLNVVEVMDPDDKAGNGFTVVVRKHE